MEVVPISGRSKSRAALKKFFSRKGREETSIDEEGSGALGESQDVGGHGTSGAKGPVATAFDILKSRRLSRPASAFRNAQNAASGELAPGGTASSLGDDCVDHVSADKSGGGSRKSGRVPTKHTFTSSGTKFSVDVRYSLIKPIGTGAYGFVCAARDGRTDANVAIKKIPDACEDLTDAKRILREIRLMRALRHENILALQDMDVPSSIGQFRDVYMVTELMDTDLSKVLRRKQPLMEEQGKFFIYQILRGLKYLHSANVLHRDLKPANILVNANCDAKICDFGLARYVDPDQQEEKTEYVVTRWYRAPELMLSHHYTEAIDMWAVGCIIAEVLTKKTLFPGKDVKNQLEVICSIIGKPTEEEMWFITSKRAHKFIAELPDTDRVPFTELFTQCNPVGVDLMEQLLQFDPKKRPTATEALKHSYLAEYHDPSDEPIADSNFDVTDLEPPGENSCTKEDLRELLWQEALHFHPELKK